MKGIMPTIIFSTFILGAPLFAVPQEKQIVGWIEYVGLYPGNLKIKAKLDTGARNSSLNATAIEKFNRNGETWIRFNIINWKDRTETFEAKIIRVAKIKQHNSEPEKRPVIQLEICLGKVLKEVEVNLVDRSNFIYQMLIGRSFLKDSFIIDPSLKFTVKPKCQGESEP